MSNIWQIRSFLVYRDSRPAVLFIDAIAIRRNFEFVRSLLAWSTKVTWLTSRDSSEIFSAECQTSGDNAIVYCVPLTTEAKTLRVMSLQ